jgi:hypothetical protein
MYEALAIALGVGIGLTFRDMRPAGRAVAVIIPLGIAAGAAVSAISGELEVSVGFLLFDTLQTTAAAMLTYVLARAWKHRGRVSSA